MIRGMGTHAVCVAHMHDVASIPNTAFAGSVFTKREWAEARRRANVAEYLAGRLAAKEAVRKAIRDVVHEPVELQRVEILGNAVGAPYVASAFAGIDAVYVSISHDAGIACALAVVE